jgi:sugar phosphate permease
MASGPNDRPKQKDRKTLMAGIAALAVAYVLSQFYRSFLAVLTPALTDELGASKLELSIASGAWFAAFALMQFVVGVSLDRYGPRRTAAILLALCGGGGAFVFAGAASPPMIVLGMTLIGAGCAPVLISTVFIFARSFSSARLAVLTSCLIGVGSLGNILGASPLAAAAEALGWRPVMAGLGCVTVLVAIALFLLVRDPERAKGAESAGFSGFIQLFKVRALWPLLLLVGLNYAPAIGIRGLWAALSFPTSTARTRC